MEPIRSIVDFCSLLINIFMCWIFTRHRWHRFNVCSEGRTDFAGKCISVNHIRNRVWKNRYQFQEIFPVFSCIWLELCLSSLLSSFFHTHSPGMRVDTEIDCDWNRNFDARIPSARYLQPSYLIYVKCRLKWLNFLLTESVALYYKRDLLQNKLKKIWFETITVEYPAHFTQLSIFPSQLNGITHWNWKNRW